MKAHKRHFPEITLPNGKRIHYLRQEEASVLYEVVPSYLKHGVTLCPGDTVFDVGSNIGMVALWLNWQFNGNINIFAFEPIPDIFTVLKLNVERYNPEKIKVFPFGLSQESKILSFGYFPKLPSLSSAYPDESQKERQQLKHTILSNLDNAPTTCKKLKLFPPLLRSFILEYALKRGLQSKIINCKVKTLSEVIQEQNISRIDWLKIDVEKSEMDVLLGIRSHDWSIIKQVSLEVHNYENRLQRIINLLKEHGLNEVVHGQEPLFKGSNVFYVHAVRSQ